MNTKKITNKILKEIKEYIAYGVSLNELKNKINNLLIKIEEK